MESTFVESVRLVFIYFSMFHCGPCREFTGLLSSLYEEQTVWYEGQKQFEVVFFSCDASEKDFNSYYKEMPWAALAYKNPRVSQLQRMANIKSVPHLIALKRSDGTILAS